MPDELIPISRPKLAFGLAVAGIGAAFGLLTIFFGGGVVMAAIFGNILVENLRSWRSPACV